jgi:hypothetical protein
VGLFSLQHDMACHQGADREDGLQLWTIVEKSGLCSLQIGHRINNAQHLSEFDTFFVNGKTTSHLECGKPEI